MSSRTKALLAVVLLASVSLAGCLDLQAAVVPSRYLEGPGGNGWERNATVSEREARSASLGLTKVQTLFYQDRAKDDEGFGGLLQVTTLRTLFTPTEESLHERLGEQLRKAAAARGIRLDGEPYGGSREVGSGAESLYIVFNGTVVKEPEGFGEVFTRNARVKILGEVWQCREERTSVVTVALTQVTSGRSVGAIPFSNSADAATWREVVADPVGSIDGVRGERGLAYHVECS